VKQSVSFAIVKGFLFKQIFNPLAIKVKLIDLRSSAISCHSVALLYASSSRSYPTYSHIKNFWSKFI
jgi:hypothetical protein